MHLDEQGLPMQADGDKNDQLQRIAMIAAAASLTGRNDELSSRCAQALTGSHQVSPGVYVRYQGGSTNNVSGDQLVAALAAHVAAKRTGQVLLMAARCIMRLGFAQNYKDGLSGQERIKLPDFMLVRALPLFTRASLLLYPIAIITDFILLLQVAAACGPVWRDDAGFSRRSPDDVDDNCTVATLAACRARMPTPASMLAAFAFAKLRPANYGGTPAVIGALRWYHRAESGGNPEVAERWEPICKEMFT
jgi:hypothetical protein